jgi:hypothetical protein
MNMTCANKDCGVELKYLRGGRLFLMERQSIPPTPSPGALYCVNASQCSSFESPSVTVSSVQKPTVVMRRYFWLCETCSQQYSIRRWTENGIELVAKAKPVRMTRAALPREWTLPGLVG